MCSDFVSSEYNGFKYYFICSKKNSKKLKLKKVFKKATNDIHN